MKKTVKQAAAFFLAIALIPLSAFLFAGEKSELFILSDMKTGRKFSVSQRDYVIGAVCCEMPASFDKQALMAQAAAVYTNAVRKKAQGEEFIAQADTAAHIGYTDTEEMKKMWGKSFDAYYKKICDAVDSISGAVITYNGKPIVAAYHSMSCGKTESAKNVWGSDVPYLIPVSSEGDTFCAEMTTQKTFTSAKAREILKKAFPDVYLPDKDSELISDLQYTASGTVISALAGDKRTTGKQIRSLFSLRSACFSVKCEMGKVTFSVSGYGHGVGLSQYGADFMARQGKSWQEIIKHYYTGCNIMKAV